MIQSTQKFTWPLTSKVNLTSEVDYKTLRSWNLEPLAVPIFSVMFYYQIGTSLTNDFWPLRSNLALEAKMQILSPYNSRAVTDIYIVLFLATSLNLCASFPEMTFDLQGQIDWPLKKEMIYSIFNDNHATFINKSRFKISSHKLFFFVAWL